MSQISPHGKVSLLHATRGRPQQARACRQEWLNAAASRERVEHILAVDADDRESIDQLADLSLRVVERAGGGCVAAWNLAASVSTGDVLVQLSDDWSPVPRWDEEFLKRLRDVTQPGVLRVNDGRRSDDLLCMAICTRPWMEAQGEFLHSGYISLYSDDEFSFRAYDHGVVIDARNLVFMHHHPNYDPGIPMDDTYSRQNSQERQQKGYDLFVKRNPAALGHWIHEGIWERHYLPASPAAGGSARISPGILDECARLGQQCARLKEELKGVENENERLRNTVARQRRSWIQRAVHRWMG